MIMSSRRKIVEGERHVPCIQSVQDIPGSLPEESGLVAFDEDGWKDDLASPTALEDWE